MSLSGEGYDSVAQTPADYRINNDCPCACVPFKAEFEGLRFGAGRDVYGFEPFVEGETKRRFAKSVEVITYSGSRTLDPISGPTVSGSVSGAITITREFDGFGFPKTAVVEGERVTTYNDGSTTHTSRWTYEPTGPFSHDVVPVWTESNPGRDFALDSSGEGDGSEEEDSEEDYYSKTSTNSGSAGNEPEEDEWSETWTRSEETSITLTDPITISDLWALQADLFSLVDSEETAGAELYYGGCRYSSDYMEYYPSYELCVAGYEAATEGLDDQIEEKEDEVSEKEGEAAAKELELEEALEELNEATSEADEYRLGAYSAAQKEHAKKRRAVEIWTKRVARDVDGAAANLEAAQAEYSAAQSALSVAASTLDGLNVTRMERKSEYDETAMELNALTEELSELSKELEILELRKERAEYNFENAENDDFPAKLFGVTLDGGFESKFEDFEVGISLVQGRYRIKVSRSDDFPVDREASVRIHWSEVFISAEDEVTSTPCDEEVTIPSGDVSAYTDWRTVAAPSTPGYYLLLGPGEQSWVIGVVKNTRSAALRKVGFLQYTPAEKPKVYKVETSSGDYSGVREVVPSMTYGPGGYVVQDFLGGDYPPARKSLATVGAGSDGREFFEPGLIESDTERSWGTHILALSGEFTNEDLKKEVSDFVSGSVTNWGGAINPMFENEACKIFSPDEMFYAESKLSHVLAVSLSDQQRMIVPEAADLVLEWDETTIDLSSGSESTSTKSETFTIERNEDFPELLLPNQDRFEHLIEIPVPSTDNQMVRVSNLRATTTDLVFRLAPRVEVLSD